MPQCTEATMIPPWNPFPSRALSVLAITRFPLFSWSMIFHLWSKRGWTLSSLQKYRPHPNACRSRGIISMVQPLNRLAVLPVQLLHNVHLPSRQSQTPRLLCPLLFSRLMTQPSPACFRFTSATKTNSRNRLDARRLKPPNSSVTPRRIS